MIIKIERKINKDFGSSEYEFSTFSSVGDLFKKLFKKDISLSDAEEEQTKFYLKLKKRIEYQPATEGTIKKKDSFLENIQNFCDVREMVIDAFKKGIIPFKDESYYQYTEEKESNWVIYLQRLIDLKNEIDNYNKNFSATFNLKKGGAKRISLSEIKRFVKDVYSGKINNKKLQKTDI